MRKVLSEFELVIALFQVNETSFQEIQRARFRRIGAIFYTFEMRIIEYS